MNRINIYENAGTGYPEERTYAGWFDHDAAEEIASFSDGEPYRYGKILLATAKGKLVVNSWSNTGSNKYRFAEDEAEIAEILADGGYDGDDKKLVEILKKYEI